jgi:GTP cyclohydrolase II
MLAHLGVESVRLMTNNPAKVAGLRNLGVHVVGRVPIVVPPTAHSARYLEAKRLRMDHDLPAASARAAPRAAAAGDAE